MLKLRLRHHTLLQYRPNHCEPSKTGCTTCSVRVHHQQLESRPRVDLLTNRSPRALKADETFSTGRCRFRYRPTPHLPHGWDAGVLLEETQKVLFCSDLIHHNGDVEAMTENDILGRVRESIVSYQAGPLMDDMSYTPQTRPLLKGLASLQPRTLATMHGSSFTGDCAKAQTELDRVMEETLDKSRG